MLNNLRCSRCWTSHRLNNVDLLRIEHSAIWVRSFPALFVRCRVYANITAARSQGDSLGHIRAEIETANLSRYIIIQ